MTDAELRSWAQRVNPERPEHGPHRYDAWCPWRDNDDAHELALRLLACLDAVRALHHETDRPPAPDRAYCDHCGEEWPCPTVQALDRETP